MHPLNASKGRQRQQPLFIPTSIKMPLVHFWSELVLFRCPRSDLNYTKLHPPPLSPLAYSKQCCAGGSDKTRVIARRETYLPPPGAVSDDNAAPWFW